MLTGQRQKYRGWIVFGVVAHDVQLLTEWGFKSSIECLRACTANFEFDCDRFSAYSLGDRALGTDRLSASACAQPT